MNWLDTSVGMLIGAIFMLLAVRERIAYAWLAVNKWKGEVRNAHRGIRRLNTRIDRILGQIVDGSVEEAMLNERIKELENEVELRKNAYDRALRAMDHAAVNGYSCGVEADAKPVSN